MPRRKVIYTNSKFSAYAPQNTHLDRGSPEVFLTDERGQNIHYNTVTNIKLAELCDTPRPADRGGNYPLPHPGRIRHR
ncbi:hypothetical protein L21_2148 [Methanoculleus chikugoensis]|jgi:hypothetical protein|uniref:Uncharacterized protein n=1 Tax=Methanoculleus chikugoensis TaxID=118126 RepID=A0A1M4MMX1_9EURY|nr:hypothetical protein L21_2148 [Methanoculleus chikugoensis]